MHGQNHIKFIKLSVYEQGITSNGEDVVRMHQLITIPLYFFHWERHIKASVDFCISEMQKPVTYLGGGADSSTLLSKFEIH